MSAPAAIFFSSFRYWYRRSSRWYLNGDTAHEMKKGVPVRARRSAMCWASCTESMSKTAVFCAALGQSPLIEKMLCISRACRAFRVVSIDLRSWATQVRCTFGTSPRARTRVAARIAFRTRPRRAAPRADANGILPELTAGVTRDAAGGDLGDHRQLGRDLEHLRFALEAGRHQFRHVDELARPHTLGEGLHLPSSFRTVFVPST